MRLRTNSGAKNGRGWIFRRLVGSEKGAELLELAFALPFFLVMIIGIIDFGGAWAAKDEVEGAARSGARAAVANFNDTTNPQCGGPCSVQVAVNAIVQNIDKANLPDCGMNASGIAASGSAFTWSDSAACPNGGTFTITVARAVPLVDGSTGTNANVLATQVTVSYPYTLQLAMTGGLIFNLGNFNSYVTLNTATTMVNLN